VTPLLYLLAGFIVGCLVSYLLLREDT